jgi:hypothetical protein
MEDSAATVADTPPGEATAAELAVELDAVPADSAALPLTDALPLMDVLLLMDVLPLSEAMPLGEDADTETSATTTITTPSPSRTTMTTD